MFFLFYSIFIFLTKICLGFSLVNYLTASCCDNTHLHLAALLTSLGVTMWLGCYGYSCSSKLNCCVLLCLHNKLTQRVQLLSLGPGPSMWLGARGNVNGGLCESILCEVRCIKSFVSWFKEKELQNYWQTFASSL